MKQSRKIKLSTILAIILMTGVAAMLFIGKPGTPSAEASIKSEVSQEISTLLNKMNLSAVADNPAVPDFELLDLEGNTVHLSDFKGETVLLGFFTTW